MKNFVKPGDVVTVFAPSGGVLSGQALAIGNLFGVAAFAAGAGAPVEIALKGVFTLPKASGVALAQGAKAYWDATAGDITSTATGNLWVGVVTDAAAGSAASVNVRLNSFPQ